MAGRKSNQLSEQSVLGPAHKSGSDDRPLPPLLIGSCPDALWPGRQLWQIPTPTPATLSRGSFPENAVRRIPATVARWCRAAHGLHGSRGEVCGRISEKAAPSDGPATSDLLLLSLSLAKKGQVTGHLIVSENSGKCAGITHTADFESSVKHTRGGLRLLPPLTDSIHRSGGTCTNVRIYLVTLCPPPPTLPSTPLVLGLYPLTPWLFPIIIRVGCCPPSSSTMLSYQYLPHSRSQSDMHT